MDQITVNGLSYVLKSRSTGQYAGPCPFGMGGDDRCGIWAETKRDAPGQLRFYCRKECSNCPGLKAHRPSAGGTAGWIGDAATVGKIEAVDPDPPPGMDKVMEYHRSLNGDTVDYLEDRGIVLPTLKRFLIGTNERRFTIPCLTGRNTKCHGIKKRWIGAPPAEYIPKYTMVPGSKGMALFNTDRLLSRSWWEYFLIVEAPLDAMVLDQMGIPAVAPFGGGGVWSVSWMRFFKHVGMIINVADYGDEDDQGWGFAETRTKQLKRGIITYPPGADRFGITDMGEAYVQLGPDVIREWLGSIVLKGEQTDDTV